MTGSGFCSFRLIRPTTGSSRAATHPEFVISMVLFLTVVLLAVFGLPVLSARQADAESVRSTVSLAREARARMYERVSPASSSQLPQAPSTPVFWQDEDVTAAVAAHPLALNAEDGYPGDWHALKSGPLACSVPGVVHWPFDGVDPYRGSSRCMSLSAATTGSRTVSWAISDDGLFLALAVMSSSGRIVHVTLAAADYASPVASILGPPGFLASVGAFDSSSTVAVSAFDGSLGDVSDRSIPKPSIPTQSFSPQTPPSTAVTSLSTPDTVLAGSPAPPTSSPSSSPPSSAPPDPEGMSPDPSSP